jgi:GTP cyclohydrolase I
MSKYEFNPLWKDSALENKFIPTIYGEEVSRERPITKGNKKMEENAGRPMSQVIRERIKSAGARFHCNDNIAGFIEDDSELDQLVTEIAVQFQGVLDSLVIDTDNDHNTRDTAHRVAKMFVRETFSGRYRKVPKVTAFPNMGYKSLYTTGPITIRSTCAHHFQNIVGKCWVGIVPDQEVIGLSKFNRLVHHICERPQIQEEMTTQISQALQEYAKTPHIAVVVKAEHFCMTQRGVREHESDMTTAIMLGAFQTDPALKKEFYDICLSMKGH